MALCFFDALLIFFGALYFLTGVVGCSTYLFVRFEVLNLPECGWIIIFSPKKLNVQSLVPDESLPVLMVFESG